MCLCRDEEFVFKHLLLNRSCHEVKLMCFSSFHPPQLIPENILGWKIVWTEKFFREVFFKKHVRPDQITIIQDIFCWDVLFSKKTSPWINFRLSPSSVHSIPVWISITKRIEFFSFHQSQRKIWIMKGKFIKETWLWTKNIRNVKDYASRREKLSQVWPHVRMFISKCVKCF